MRRNGAFGSDVIALHLEARNLVFVSAFWRFITLEYTWAKRLGMVRKPTSVAPWTADDHGDELKHIGVASVEVILQFEISGTHRSLINSSTQRVATEPGERTTDGDPLITVVDVFRGGDGEVCSYGQRPARAGSASSAARTGHNFDLRVDAFCGHGISGLGKLEVF